MPLLQPLTIQILARACDLKQRLLSEWTAGHVWQSELLHLNTHNSSLPPVLVLTKYLLPLILMLDYELLFESLWS